MKESGVVRSVVVVTLLAVLAELFVQARNYAWLWDFFEGDGRGPASGLPPYDHAVVRGLWIVATALLVVTVTLVGNRRWLPGVALLALAGSIWLTPSRMILPGQDADTFHLGLGEPDRSFQAALALVALAAVALVALLLMPKKSA